MAFLEFKKVGKSYSGTEVLRNINLRIDKGEFVAIVGYSGAGKTTLLSLIAGLIRPDSGMVTLNDLEITEPGPDRGVVFQNYSLLPWLTVYENIFLGVNQVFPNWPVARKHEHTKKFISLVNLLPASQKRPAQLSGGMRQRVSLARALAIDPQVLLLDEPLSALDALTRATLQEELGRICLEAGKTIVLVTNDVDEGILLADRIIPLSAGPGATLGPAIEINLPRPRDRRALNHSTKFKSIRNSVITYLLKEGAKERQTETRKVILPNIEPEDLSKPRPMFKRPPLRRTEVKTEEVVNL